MEFRKKYFTLAVRLKHYATFPIIGGLIIPLLFLDISLEIYHRISFPLYGIPTVKRQNYIRIDRHKLSYLKWYEKIFCTYCGYANGILHYASIIAGETEKYWCGIKHKESNDFTPPSHHKNFVGYDDKENLEKRYPRPNY